VQPQSIPCFGPRNLQGEIKEGAHIETGKEGQTKRTVCAGPRKLQGEIEEKLHPIYTKNIKKGGNKINRT
jgi:hypothetical protein